jgi:hypothetical protein
MLFVVYKNMLLCCLLFIRMYVIMLFVLDYSPPVIYNDNYSYGDAIAVTLLKYQHWLQ